MTPITFLNFDKDGALTSGDPTPPADATDLVLVVHGWHEDQSSAATHYTNLLAPLETILEAEPARWGARKLALYGVIWPSDKYADDLTIIDMRPEVGGPPPAPLVPEAMTPLSDAALADRARAVAALLGVADPDRLAALAVSAASDPSACDQLVATLQGVAQGRQTLADKQTLADHDTAFTQSGGTLFNMIGAEVSHLASQVGAVLTDNPLVQWLKNLRQDANAMVAHILNTFAYNELKIRAGVVGQGLAHAMLNTITPKVRIHLVGHSFGGRVMASATASATRTIDNLTLLEGAFSQNAFSQDPTDPAAPLPGAFRAIIDKSQITGRIAAVCSENDTAVWIAYPLASRVFRDSESLGPAGPLGEIFGGPTDRYGAMGANGPQNLASVMRWRFSGNALPGLVRGVHTLDCTSFVSSHTDVWRAECAYVVAAGLLL